MHYINKNYVLNSFNNENECINDTLSVVMSYIDNTRPNACPSKRRMLESYVEKFSKILIKSSNITESIKSDNQNIEAPIIDDHIIECIKKCTYKFT